MATQVILIVSSKLSDGGDHLLTIVVFFVNNILLANVAVEAAAYAMVGGRQPEDG